MDRGRAGGANSDAAWVSRLVLAPDPSAVREARAFVRTCCQAAGTAGDACEIAVLLTSETVTNAFIHGRSEARLAVTARADSLLVEVGDDNSVAPEPVEQHPGAVSGRGLLILDTLAHNWGVSDDHYGKLVWFEVQTNQTRLDPRCRP